MVTGEIGKGRCNYKVFYGMWEDKNVFLKGEGRLIFISED